MKRTVPALLMSAALLALCACHPGRPTAGNTVHADPPDWRGGRWDRDPQPGDAPDIGQLRGDGLPLTPEWRKKSDELDRLRATGGELHGNDSLCIPSGMPFMMIANSLEFLYSPNRIGILAGTRGLQIRNIFLNRAHTADQYLLDSFSGESVGHWEGDTLIVDTVGLRPSNELVYGLKGSHLHVVERFHQTGPDALQIDTTVTDPKALASPWTYSTHYTRHPDRLIDDSVYCVSALDRSVDSRTGEEGFDLTPPPEQGIGVPQAPRGN